MRKDMKKRVVVIGGGLGGLFTGAILAKEGLQVTVLEKNINIGGGLQTFFRNGEEFETSMHILGGFQPGGTLDKICIYLGIVGCLDFAPDGNDCIDRVTYLCDGAEYRLPGGRDAFVAYLSGRFPSEAAGIQGFVDLMYSMAAEVDIFNLRPTENFLAAHSIDFFRPIDEVMAGYVSDIRLKELLSFINPMYGGVKGHTPAYVHAIITVLYLNGQSKFRGGSRQLTEALVGVIEGHGGHVEGGCPVTSIGVEQKNVTYVETADGVRHTADVYVSAIHPCALLALLPPGTFNRTFTARLNEIPNSYSAFSAYFVMKPGMFPYLPGVNFCQRDYGTCWNLADTADGVWPLGMMYITPCDNRQGRWARKVIVNCVMEFDEVRRWEHTRLGARPKEYDEWKRGKVAQITDIMGQLYPGFGAMVEHSYSASPLTIRDYYGVKDGSLYGYRKDSSNMALSQMSVFTKVKNLMLTGQCINLHGICGVPLTAINTAEGILGLNVVVNKINEAYEKGL